MRARTGDEVGGTIGTILNGGFWLQASLARSLAVRVLGILDMISVLKAYNAFVTRDCTIL